MVEVTVAEENSKTTEYLDKLFVQLQETLLKEQDSLKPVILKKDSPKFHLSIADRLYVEIKDSADLFIMMDKEVKDGKVYVYSPWSWGAGRVFLILEDYLEDLEPN